MVYCLKLRNTSSGPTVCCYHGLNTNNPDNESDSHSDKSHTALSDKSCKSSMCE